MYEENLAAWGKQADDEILAKNAEILRLRHVVRSLKKKLAGDPPVTPPVTPATLIGVAPGDPWKNNGSGNNESNMVRIQSSIGKNFDCRRSYNTPGHVSDFSHTPMKDDLGKRVSIHSFKPVVPNEPGWKRTASGVDNAEIKAYFMSFPLEHEVYESYNHEPENDGPPEYFIKANIVVASILAEVNDWRKSQGGKPILFGGTLMSFDTNRWSTYVPPEGTWAFLSFDGYAWADESTPRSAEQIFGASLDKAASLGFTKLGIAEWGNGHGDKMDRSQWIADSISYFKARGLDFETYWDQYEFSLKAEELHALIP